MGRLYEPWICNVAFTRESKLSQIKAPSHLHHLVVAHSQSQNTIRYAH